MGIAYTTRTGLKQWKPTLEEIKEGDADDTGWCLDCGELTTPAEPDAVKYTCDVCGKPKVYGCVELALRGLVA